MRKIKYLLLFVICFLFVGVVSAANISLDTLISTIKTSGANAELAGNMLTVTVNGQSRTYLYDEATNTISYELNASDGDNITSIIKNSSNGMLGWVAKSSANYAKYNEVRDNNIALVYDQSCDLTGMGVCYDAELKKFSIKLDDTFVNFLITEYGGTVPSDGSTTTGGSVPSGDSSKQTLDGQSTYSNGEAPEHTPSEPGDPVSDAKNPNTGSFAQYGVVIVLVSLLLLVIILKKRSETEYKL